MEKHSVQDQHRSTLKLTQQRRKGNGEHGKGISQIKLASMQVLCGRPYHRIGI